jgi:flagellar hook assembly protein FlgD
MAVEPSPFRSTVWIRLGLPGREEVRVEVFDVSGRSVATLHDGAAGPGPVSLQWDGRDHVGAPCASGVYFLRATGASKSLISKTTLLR